ncbi:unnamed protein product [marine sediment metagenome]|uniref:Uncharacterized protein n=1 Tax=marine sediment metagenome TaxID=412755 RepID=X0W6L2_9ZZZZ
MKVEITDVYYIKGADDLERVKVSYLIMLGEVRIVGQLFVDPYPTDTMEARIVPAIKEDLSTKTEVIEAVQAAAAAFVGQDVDVETLLDKEP